MMHFHYGYGVGHLYSHNVRVVEMPSPITQTAAQTADETWKAEEASGNLLSGKLLLMKRTLMMLKLVRRSMIFLIMVSLPAQSH
jgi:hypothetical protein